MLNCPSRNCYTDTKLYWPIGFPPGIEAEHIGFWKITSPFSPRKGFYSDSKRCFWSFAWLNFRHLRRGTALIVIGGASGSCSCSHCAQFGIFGRPQLAALGGANHHCCTLGFELRGHSNLSYVLHLLHRSEM